MRKKGGKCVQVSMCIYYWVLGLTLKSRSGIVLESMDTEVVFRSHFLQM